MKNTYKNAVAYNTDDRRLREFLYKFRIEEVTTESRQVYHDTADYYNNYTVGNADFYSEYTTRYEVRDIVSVKIPLEDFKKLSDTVMEFDELMADPASRSQIMEAKFLYRLRHGTTF